MNEIRVGARWDACLRRRGDLSVEEVAGETLVLDDLGGCVHQLNPTAGFIWKQCDGQTSLQRIAERLVEEFDVAENVARQDVASAIAHLCKLHLLCE